jgi:hypothetical protein
MTLIVRQALIAIAVAVAFVAIFDFHRCRTGLANNGDDPMSRSQQDLVHIARYGGGLDISAKDHTQDNLVQLATNIAAGKATLIFRDIASKPTGELVNIAAAATGRVIFVDP